MSLRPFLRPSRSAALAAALLVVGATACGDTGKITVSDQPAPTTTADPAGEQATTSSEPVDETTTTMTGAGDESVGTVPAGDAGAGPSTAAADQDARDNSWIASPGEYRGQDGLRVAYNCPAGGSITSVWGTGPFTDDSSVCTAGVFLGLITPEGGGRIVVEIAPGEASYATGEAHGVTAQSYGTWAGSFVVVTSD